MLLRACLVYDWFTRSHPWKEENPTRNRLCERPSDVCSRCVGQGPDVTPHSVKCYLYNALWLITPTRLAFHWCSICVRSCSFVFARVHSCSLVFTCVHSCSDSCGVLDLILLSNVKQEGKNHTRTLHTFTKQTHDMIHIIRQDPSIF
jgi:hypothetical protein